MSAIQVLTAGAAVGSGLLAGVYGVFSIAVMPALDRVAPENGLRAMQQINDRIQNPLFFVVFMGAPLVAIAAAALGMARRAELGSPWVGWMLVAGSVLLIVGSLAITVVANVPRNDALAALDPAAAGSAAAWKTYVTDWTRWNHARAVLCLLATACFAVAALGE